MVRYDSGGWKHLTLRPNLSYGWHTVPSGTPGRGIRVTAYCYRDAGRVRRRELRKCSSKGSAVLAEGYLLNVHTAGGERLVLERGIDLRTNWKPAPSKCRSGGIGRHLGLKIPWEQSRAGSIPVSGTKVIRVG